MKSNTFFTHPVNGTLKTVQKTFVLLSIMCFGINLNAQEPDLRFKNITHHVVAWQADQFYAWPANSGLIYPFGKDEFLIGFTRGDYVLKSGHNISQEAHANGLARTTDGGQTWTVSFPETLITNAKELKQLDKPINFKNKNLIIRISGIGYHGNDEPRGALYYSYDKGVTWNGPFAINGIMDNPDLQGYEFTARTDYIVRSKNECLFFMSARPPKKGMVDRLFCAETKDGGKTFRIKGWIVPPSDPYRGVMSSSVALDDNHLISSVRRRDVSRNDSCWVDVYESKDGGTSWKHLSYVGSTGIENGNPPALAKMKDGRLCCVYGNRTLKAMIARFSSDQGKTWGKEIVIRNDFAADSYGDSDFGYPRAIQRSDGKIVAVYYFATKEHKEHYIAASIFDPDAVETRVTQAGK